MANPAPNESKKLSKLNPPSGPPMGSGGLSFMRPVCVECLELNGCCLANLPKTAFWREGDSQMVCCLSGSVQLHVSTNGHVCEYTIPAGSFGYYHGHCGGRYDTYATESEARVLQIHFPGKALAAMLGDAWLPPRSTCPRKDGTFAGMVREITPPMNRIITSIKEALRRKAGNDLYLLAKSLELLSLLKDSEAEVFGARMDSRDRRAIQEAVDIMTRRLDTPPGLTELAHRVGMSVSKFKALFPKACGATPYEYLRQMRMERAMSLLRQGDLNVTQVALDVGYASISHFAKTFRKTYEMYPSEVRGDSQRRFGAR